MSLPNQPFSWTFAAFFKESPVIQQGHEDHLPTSNEFQKVKQRQDELVAFELHHIDGQQVVTVDLMSGNFIVNGTPICIHNQNFEPMKYKLELVYFREKREVATAAGTVLEDNELDYSKAVHKQSFVNRYFIGWKTQVNGKDKQVTLAVG